MFTCLSTYVMDTERFDSFLLVSVAVILVLLVVTATSCTTDSTTTPPSEQSHRSEKQGLVGDAAKSCFEVGRIEFSLRGTHGGGELWVTLNGFPVEHSTGVMRYTQRQAPLHSALVRGQNRIRLLSTPLVRVFAGALKVQEHEGLQGSIECNRKPLEAGRVSSSQVDSAASAWRERADSVWRETRRSGPVGAALDSVRAWARAHPMTVSVTFDNAAGPDYSDIFREAPVIAGTAADSARLRAYAMQLRDWMAAKDTTALVTAYLPAFWKGRAPLTPLDSVWASFDSDRRRTIREYVVMSNAYLSFDRDNVGLRKWVDGRVWELYYKQEQAPLLVEVPLRRSGPEYRGMGRKRDTYVAEINGTLRIVRK